VSFMEPEPSSTSSHYLPTPLTPLLSQINPIDTLVYYFTVCHTAILPSTPRLSKCSFSSRDRYILTEGCFLNNNNNTTVRGKDYLSTDEVIWRGII
jgi:hypothetical protein